MSLTASELTPADIAAVTGNNGNGGMWGGDGSWWIILLFLCLFNGGWNNGGYGGGNSGAGALYPWMNQADITNSGFRDQMINGNIGAIQQGINNLSTQLCGCCGDTQMALANGFSQAEIAANGRQMANMNQAFTAQTAMNAGFNGIQSALAQCCCENRLASADLKYTIATENCADRAAISDGIRDLLAATQNQTQRILDQMCADKIDAKNERIAELQQQLQMAQLAASQGAQTAQILTAGVAADGHLVGVGAGVRRLATDDGPTGVLAARLLGAARRGPDEGGGHERHHQSQSCDGRPHTAHVCPLSFPSRWRHPRPPVRCC